MTGLFVHHATIAARRGDPDNGTGSFDVVEDSEGFKVIARSDYLDRYSTLRRALARARREARNFDRRARKQPSAPAGWRLQSEAGQDEEVFPTRDAAEQMALRIDRLNPGLPALKIIAA